MRASARVKDVSSEQIGSALRRLAEELVAERRRVAQLERENKALKAQVETLQRAAAEAEKRSSAA
jgi:cell division protein FtsB